MSRSQVAIQDWQSQAEKGVVYRDSGYNSATISDINLEQDGTGMTAGAAVSTVRDNVLEVDIPGVSTSLPPTFIPAERTESSSQISPPSTHETLHEITPRHTQETFSSSRTVGKFKEEFDVKPATPEESLEALCNVSPSPDPLSNSCTGYILSTRTSLSDATRTDCTNGRFGFSSFVNTYRQVATFCKKAWGFQQSRGWWRRMNPGSRGSVTPGIPRVSETQPQPQDEVIDTGEDDTICFLPSCKVCDETIHPQDQCQATLNPWQDNSNTSYRWRTLEEPVAPSSFSKDLQSTIENMTVKNGVVTDSQEQDLGSTLVDQNQNNKSTYQEEQAIRAERLRCLLEGWDEDDQEGVDPGVAEAYGAIRIHL